MEGWVRPESGPAPEGEEADLVYFRNLPIHDRILRGILDDLKFKHCSPIQGKSLPVTLTGRDLAGKAQTGTGKTAAFLITIFQRFLDNPGERKPNQPFALVLAPTRELAMQIDKDAAQMNQYSGLGHVAVYGGIDYDKQRRWIEAGVDLVAATPGRLLDYSRRGVLDLSAVKVLVIDEADRMLDMGFIPDIRRIVGMLPRADKRQTLLFSATLPPNILQLAEAWMNDPVTVEVDPERMVAEGVEEIVYTVTAKDKLSMLLWYLKNDNCKRALVFRNRRDACDRLFMHLQRYDINCALLSGDVPQNKRQRVLEQFRAGEIDLIVATDVAGRGIHVDDVSHVFNYDLPYEADDYVHRIGRTGRAGQSGKAVSFACEERSFVLPEIEEYIQRPLACIWPEDEMLVLPPPLHNRPPEQRRPSRRQPTRRSGSGGPRRSSGGRPR
jgi:ATP-dependent RNA helicase RhlB